MKNKLVRGFQHLLDETIVKIDATGINHVSILTSSGKLVAISADSLHYGIPVIECIEMETQFTVKKDITK